MVAALSILLGDGRFPDGSHAHSGGIEEAVEQRAVLDTASLAAFLEGRLVTAGVVAASVVASVCRRRFEPPPAAEVPRCSVPRLR